MRNPLKLYRSVVKYQKRAAERKYLGKLLHEPPRKTRPEQFPVVLAVPLMGAPL